MLSETGSESAILVLDLTKEAIDKSDINRSAVHDILSYIEGELSYFRERVRPVVFCNTYLLNGVESQNIDRFKPRLGEVVINKTRPNAFFSTNLSQVLQSLKVGKITIVGAFLHTGILLTAAHALDIGFSVVVPETCVFGPEEEGKLAFQLLQKWQIEKREIKNDIARIDAVI